MGRGNLLNWSFTDRSKCFASKLMKTTWDHNSDAWKYCSVMWRYVCTLKLLTFRWNHLHRPSSQVGLQVPINTDFLPPRRINTEESNCHIRIPYNPNFHTKTLQILFSELPAEEGKSRFPPHKKGNIFSFYCSNYAKVHS